MRLSCYQKKSSKDQSRNDKWLAHDHKRLLRGIGLRASPLEYFPKRFKFFSTDENRPFMYADGHRLFSDAKSSNEAERILTREGNNICEWYKNQSSARKHFKVPDDESGSEELPKGFTHRDWRRWDWSEVRDNSLRSYIRRPANILEPCKQGLRQKSLLSNGCPLEIT